MKLSYSRLMLGLALAGITTGMLIGCNKTPEPAPATQMTPVAADTEKEDSAITSNVKSALLADAALKGLDLQVETRKGTVQLSGSVDNQANIDQALSVTRAVAGVSAVENNLSLKTAPTTVGTKIDDATVTGRVKAALLADPVIKSFDISVATTSGEVQLTGLVDNQGQIDQAARIARAAEGATSIKSDLRIKQ